MKKQPASAGEFFFRYRTFLPIPLFIVILLFFPPLHLKKGNTLLILFGLLVTLGGETIRIATVGYSALGTSGRENYLKADQLNTSGLYSLVRNPLYWGNLAIYAGLLIVFGNPFAFFLGLLFLIGEYLLIIRAEETFLSEQYGALFLNYRGKVHRWIPHWKNWIPPSLPFDGKKALFKENDSVFNLFMGLFIILAVREKSIWGRIEEPLRYLAPAVLLVLGYIMVKIAKKSRSRFVSENRSGEKK